MGKYHIENTVQAKAIQTRYTCVKVLNLEVKPEAGP